MAYKQNHANIKEWAANYKGELFDGILCDPPYELGFMGKSWDSSGIAFDTEMWADILKLLKPGGHLLAFSGSRTYHRMAVAIEDAGFEIRDMIEWVYGSGFPKSLNIGKAVDKIQGNEREVVGERKQRANSENSNIKMNDCPSEVEIVTKGTSEWEGWGTALKPSHEPICMARKPLGEKTVAENCLKYGTGGINIDGCRVGTEEKLGRQASSTTMFGNGKMTKEDVIDNSNAAGGRFPANLIHDGSDEVEAVFPDTTTGSASRYFYCAKASKSERNAGLEGFEEVVKPLMGEFKDNPGRETPKSSPTPRANYHPTVKPLSLTKYLATLIKPPTGGRLLVPFSGSGSEMIGALQAGWEYVEGVELTEEYIPIAEARIKHWTSKPNQGKLL